MGGFRIRATNGCHFILCSQILFFNRMKIAHGVNFKRIEQKKDQAGCMIQPA
jgi:hypothetical protein